MKKTLIVLLLLFVTAGCACISKVENKPAQVNTNTNLSREEILRIISHEVGISSDAMKEVDIYTNKTGNDKETTVVFSSEDTRYKYKLNNNAEIIYSKKYSTLEESMGNKDDLSNLSDSISEQEALQIALNHAEVLEKDIILTKSKLDRSYTHSEYEIEFYTSKFEYEYEIGMKGEIISFERDFR